MPIKASELRVGNWVADDAPACPVYRRIDADLIKYVEVNGEGTMFAIPLTPEILEKAGFVKSTNGYGDGIPTFGKFEASFYDGDNFVKQLVSVRYDQKIIIKVAFLHQLQNLYFALTRTELEINLNP